MTFIRKKDPVSSDAGASPRGLLLRRMVWIETDRIEAWGCSACAWTFSPSGPPAGADLEEMKRNFERRRDKEYAGHVCAEHARGRDARHDSIFSRRPGD